MTTEPQYLNEPRREEVVRLICAAIPNESDDSKTDISHIAKDNAQDVLDVLWGLLDQSPTRASILPEKSRRTPSVKALRVLALKLAVKYGMLPSEFYLPGVKSSDWESRGTGGFADVFYGHREGQEVALKRVRNTSLKAIFYREALVWKRLDHTHVATFLGVSRDAFHHISPSGSTCLVICWYKNGNIRHHIDTLKSQGQLQGQNFVISVNKWLHEIATGLAYLHSEGIVHGDLHGANILVDDEGHVRLTDFGRSINVTERPGQYASSYDGDAYWYRAPELHEPHSTPSPFHFGSTKYTVEQTPSSDVYAFACTSIELYENRTPFQVGNDGKCQFRTPYQLSKFVLSGGRPPQPSNMPGSMWQLTERCWNQKPIRRPTAQAAADSISTIMSGGELKPQTRMFNVSTVVSRLVGSRRRLPISAHGKFASDLYEANSALNL